MATPFVSVARVAIDDIFKKHAKPSKFGYFLSEESLENLVEELTGFLETSRNLKSAGDRLLQNQTENRPQKPTSKVPPNLSR